MTLQIIHASVATFVAFAALNQPAFADPQAKPAQLMINFQAADVNQSGELDMAEFKKFINLNADHNLGQATKIRRLGMYAAAFDTADADDDGAVSKAEIAAQVVD